MRMLFVILIILLLSACSAPGAEPTLAPTAPPIDTAAPPPTPTAEPTEPATEAPTPTAPPVETVDVEPSAGAFEPGDTPAEESPSMEDEAILPEEAVILLGQEGGFAGVMNTWVIFPDGRVVDKSGAEFQVKPELVAGLLETIDQSGFYSLSQPKPSDVCCDFFTYTLIASEGSQRNAITLSEADPNMPESLLLTIRAVQELIDAGTPSQ